MTRTLAAAAFLAAALPLARADDKDDAAKKLNGTYEVVSVVVGGKADDKGKDATAVIKDGTITIKEGPKGRDEVAKFTVDASKKPAHIDILPGKDVTVFGIYELKDTDKGTELTVAFVKEGGAATRPKDFKGEGKDEIVMKLFRKKEK